MFYSVCPTCGFLFADKELDFYNKLEKVKCNNIENKSNDNIIIGNILDELNIKRYCCRMRIITYIDLVKEIK